MVGRAEIAQPSLRLALDAPATAPRSGATCRSPARPRQHHPALASFRLLPAPQQQVELLVAPDERRRLRAQRLEAAQDAAFADHAPGALRLGKTGERLRPEILDLEERADLPSRALGDDERARLASACSRAARFGVSPTTPRSCAAPAPIRSPTTTSPLAMPSRTFSGSGVASRRPRR